MKTTFSGGETKNGLFRISRREGNFKSDYYLSKRQIKGIEVYEQTPFETSFTMKIDFAYIGERAGHVIDIDNREVANEFMLWLNGTTVFEEGDK